MSVHAMPRGKNGNFWSEEEPIMEFFKDGDLLRIVAERLQGGSDEVYLTKDKAAQIVQFIQQNAVAKKSILVV